MFPYNFFKTILHFIDEFAKLNCLEDQMQCLWSTKGQFFWKYILHKAEGKAGLGCKDSVSIGSPNFRNEEGILFVTLDNASVEETECNGIYELVKS